MSKSCKIFLLFRSFTFIGYLTSCIFPHLEKLFKVTSKLCSDFTVFDKFSFKFSIFLDQISFIKTFTLSFAFSVYKLSSKIFFSLE